MSRSIIKDHGTRGKQLDKCIQVYTVYNTTYHILLPRPYAGYKYR